MNINSVDPQNESLTCPHCYKEIHALCRGTQFISEISENFFAIGVYHAQCPACKELILFWKEVRRKETETVVFLPGATIGMSRAHARFIYPQGSHRKPPHSDVPKEFADDYKEACLILESSPQASAALGRRVLQHIIREKAGIKEKNLDQEIQKLVDSKCLPSHLTESLDAVRNLGNMAAHPMKNETTGEIIPVTCAEAEWTLDVIESLFDFYFVQPAETEKKRAALDAKLCAAGKPPLK